VTTANLVPETWNLTGSDTKKTLAEADKGRLLRDAFVRLRASDGFSNARSMAFATSLILIQGLIALVGLASALDKGRVSDAIVAMLHDVFPGPAGNVLTDAVQQAHEAGAQHRSLALTLGVIGALITGTTLLGQIEKSMNRIYGIEPDRSSVPKYLRAFVLTISAGLLAVAAFVATTLGSGVAALWEDPAARDIWSIVRWPLAFGLLVGATACIFRWSPRRHQPSWSWLAMGAILSVVLVLIVTIALSAIFELTSGLGQTYGPLAGFVALLLWTYLDAIALLYGVAVGAQLEAVRAGSPAPRKTAEADGVTPERPRSEAPAPTASARAGT
jgi:YihY family inner membrane protein